MKIRELESLKTIDIDKEYIDLLHILELTNPCQQNYIQGEDLFMIFI